MQEYKETITVNTHFGTVRISYSPKTMVPVFSENVFEEKTEEKESGYVSKVLDGEFTGWNSFASSRQISLSNLMQEISSRYARDLLK